MQKREPGLPWVAIVATGVFMAVVLGLGLLIWHGPNRPARSGPPAYAAQLSLSEVKVSQMQNFLGAIVTNLDGTIINQGDKTITSAMVEATFRNSLGEVVQQEEQPLKVVNRSGPYPDAIDLRLSPMAPHQTREFRLIFEHISADWNQQQPGLRITALTLQ